MPQITAMSVPGRCCTCSVAIAAVRVKRGSTTMKGALLRSLAVRMCCIATGCASAGLPPKVMIDFDLRMSGKLLVMAP